MDSLACLVAGACHDFGHDGLTNAFHVTTMSDRAIRYNDVSVQESYHAAESLTLLLQSKNNFLEEFSAEEFRSFKRRMVSAIMSTDMAKHSSDLESFKRRLELSGVKSSLNNGNMFIDKTDGKKMFETQQQAIEIAIHTADISAASRPDFEVIKKWTYLLYDEFFA